MPTPNGVNYLFQFLQFSSNSPIVRNKNLKADIHPISPFLYLSQPIGIYSFKELYIYSVLSKAKLVQAERNGASSNCWGAAEFRTLLCAKIGNLIESSKFSSTFLRKYVKLSLKMDRRKTSNALLRYFSANFQRGLALAVHLATAQNHFSVENENDSWFILYFARLFVPFSRKK